MDKPILQWDRSQCSEQVCTCHDDSSPPRFCTGCGCNVASPGHRNTLEALDARDARIAELEGALRALLSITRPGPHDRNAKDEPHVELCRRWNDARRVLGGAS